MSLNYVIYSDLMKTIIFIVKFTHDNLCSIEFDAYCFSVKDFQTKKFLLQCQLW